MEVTACGSAGLQGGCHLLCHEVCFGCRVPRAQCAMKGAVFDGTWIPSCHEVAVWYEVPKPQCVMLSALCFMVPRSQYAVEGDG